MATFPEIADLFSKLAFHLQTLTHSPPTDNREEEEDSYYIDLAISKLNHSLNLVDNAGVNVLDTALSLMCFKAPQVFNSMIEYLIRTVTSVLQSSVSCTVLRFETEEVLQVGSSISQRDCFEFIDVVNDVISKLDEHGIPSSLLLHAAAKVMVSSSYYRFLVPSMHILDFHSIDRRSIVISNFVHHLPRESSLNNHEIPLRLLSWYIDPLTLKHDISNILLDTMKRPFLSLSKGFYERMDWRSTIICLVLSPSLFIQTRALLHDWFMLTGMGPVLELLIELVSVILDVISRPTWWGISMELGSKLPFSNVYFPCKNYWFRIFSGPLSSSSFLRLVHGNTDMTSKPPAINIMSLVDSKSLWSLAISFPDWFHLASVLLFFNSSFQNTSALGIPEFGEKSGLKLPADAASYIAWILSPDNKSLQDLLFDNLVKISESWTLKQTNLDICGRGAADYRKKLKKHACYDVEEDLSLGNKYSYQDIGLWLREFHSIIQHVYEPIKNISSSLGEKLYTSILRKNMLFRKIPLGILIGYSSYVKEDGFELLLHYAATGRVLHSTTGNARTAHLGQNSGGLGEILGSNDCTREEAISGVCLVFSLTDTIDRMSASLFDNEQSGMDIISQVKLMASRYLIKCINRIIQPDMVGNENVMLVDLHNRLEQWQHQGQEMLNLDKDIDNTIRHLSNKLLLLSL